MGLLGNKLQLFKNCFHIAVLCLFAFESYGSTLSLHQWQSRVLLVSSTSPKQTQNFLRQFERHAAKLFEYKLIIYIVDQDRVRVYPDNTKAKVTNATSLNVMVKNHAAVLIGLDGSVKGHYQKMDLDSVFSEINQMPMRRAELNKGM